MMRNEADKALVLFGHGARDPEWARPMQRVQAGVQARVGEGVRVELAFLEFMQPNLDAVLSELVGQGVRQIVILPMFLAQGGHLKRDLPALVEAARLRHSAASITLAGAVGEADAIVEAMAQHALSLIPTA